MSTTTSSLTQADIERGENDERWLGFGYLGERENASGTPERVAEADAAVLAAANAAGWTYEDLFQWLNSKPGRWFGDLAFGWTDPMDVQVARAHREGLFSKVDD